LSNLYSSSQLSPYLIYQLDKQLYASASINDHKSDDDNAQHHPNLESLFKLFNYSSLSKQTVLNIAAISSVALCYSSIRFNKNSTKTSATNRLDEHLKRFRAILIKSDVIRKFACLLTSLQPKIQLNALKFYASICFENTDASRLILTTNYYDMNLLDLISAYLSRENGPELQLYAAKCLANLYRTSLMQQSRAKTSKAESLASDAASSILKAQDQNVESMLGAKPSSVFKLVSQKSQLIKLRTLPTLIRLCCTYSLSYRSANFSSSTSSTKHLSTFLLIESVSTLTYLIELSTELQLTASYLEQIITILSSNILNAFTMSSLTNEGAGEAELGASFPKASAASAGEVLGKKQASLSRLKGSSFKSSRGRNGTAVRKSKYLCSTPLVGGSSIFSVFYLNYNQFAAKGIHLKLNEHQYRTNLVTFKSVIIEIFCLITIAIRFKIFVLI
jgi:hypothetical protein